MWMHCFCKGAKAASMQFVYVRVTSLGSQGGEHVLWPYVLCPADVAIYVSTNAWRPLSWNVENNIQIASCSPFLCSLQPKEKYIAVASTLPVPECTNFDTLFWGIVQCLASWNMAGDNQTCNISLETTDPQTRWDCTVIPWVCWELLEFLMPLLEGSDDAPSPWA